MTGPLVGLDTRAARFAEEAPDAQFTIDCTVHDFDRVWALLSNAGLKPQVVARRAFGHGSPIIAIETTKDRDSLRTYLVWLGLEVGRQ